MNGGGKLGATTVGEVLAAAVAELSAAGVAAPDHDAAILLGELMGGLGPAEVRLRRREPVEAATARRFFAGVARRARREPLQHILGHWEFMGLDFLVDGRALVPRPETELVVEAALDLLGVLGKGRPEVVVADIGTGSGIIAVSLAVLGPAIVHASDVSAGALELARTNAGRLLATTGQGAGRIVFHRGDLAAPLIAAGIGVDLVVANLPYVRSGDIAALEPEVSRYDPRVALDGGPDGLELYRRLVGQLAEMPRRPAAVVLEIGDGQGEAMTALFDRRGAGTTGASPIDAWRTEVRRDLAGRERVLVAVAGAGGALRLSGV